MQSDVDCSEELCVYGMFILELNKMLRLEPPVDLIAKVEASTPLREFLKELAQRLCDAEAALHDKSSRQDLEKLQAKVIGLEDKVQEQQKELETFHELQRLATETEGSLLCRIAELEKTIRFLSEKSASQVDLNALRAADATYLRSQLEDVNNRISCMEQRQADESAEIIREVNGTASSTPVRPDITSSGALTPVLPEEDSKSARTVTVALVRRVSERVERIQQLFELTGASIQEAVSGSSRDKVRLLHSVPSFHLMWTELFRINQRLDAMLLGGTAPRSRNGEAVADGRPATIPLTSDRAYMQQSNSDAQQRKRADYPEVIFLPSLGIDVGPVSREQRRSTPAQGAIVHRVVRGSVMDLSGVCAGDTVEAVDGVVVRNAPELADYVSRQPLGHQVRVSLRPNGRTKSVPLMVTLAVEE